MPQLGRYIRISCAAMLKQLPYILQGGTPLTVLLTPTDARCSQRLPPCLSRQKRVPASSTPGVCRRNDPLLEIAMELEHIATHDEYFVKRGLYPNVDFFSGIVLRAMGIPVSM